MTKVQLRLAGCLQEHGFSVERRKDCGDEYLVVGYGQGALGKKLDGCCRTLNNKLQWSGHPEGIRAIAQVLKLYQEGELL